MLGSSRRSRSGSSRSSCSSNGEAQVLQVKGQAYLCFSQDGAWFQGYLATQDDSTYTLRGKRVRKQGLKDHPSQQHKDQEEEEEDVVIHRWCNHSFESTKGPSTQRECISSSPPKRNDSCSAEEQQNGIPVEYNVTLVDHDTGSDIVLPRVKGLNGQMCTFQDQEVSFVTEHVYKGIKADMVIQKYLGSSLVGQNCHVFCGPMTISYREVLPNGRKWCL